MWARDAHGQRCCHIDSLWECCHKPTDRIIRHLNKSLSRMTRQMLGVCLHRHTRRSTMGLADFAKQQRHCMICGVHPKVSQILTFFSYKLPRMGYELWFKNPKTYDFAMQGTCCCCPQMPQSQKKHLPPVHAVIAQAHLQGYPTLESDGVYTVLAQARLHLDLCWCFPVFFRRGDAYF